MTESSLKLTNVSSTSGYATSSSVHETTTHANFSFETTTVDDHSFHGGHTTLGIVAIALVAIALMALTVLGNLLVIISYHRNRRLRSINNLFLISLACSDLCIGLTSMNLYPIYMVSKKWFFGILLCDIWLCIDYTLSMASVSNLMLICVDRYLSVTRPFTYRSNRTRCRARIGIVIAWTISFLMWSPAIIIWPRINNPDRYETHDHKCYIAFLVEPSITLLTAFLAFYLPVVVMAVLYWRIYLETKRCSQYLEYLKNYKQNNRSRKYSQVAALSRRRKSRGTVNKNNNDNNAQALLTKNGSRGEEHILFPSARKTSVISEESDEAVGHRKSSVSQLTSDTENYKPRSRAFSDVIRSSNPFKKSSKGPSITIEETSHGPEDEDTFHSPQQAKVPSSEKKAARTLSAILIVFIITWLPYNICAVVGGFMGPEAIPTAVWDAAYYLCYVNSTLNPFCFALCNKTFRKTFIEILTCSKGGSTGQPSKCKLCFPFFKSQHGERHSERFGQSTSSSRSNPPSPSFTQLHSSNTIVTATYNNNFS